MLSIFNIHKIYNNIGKLLTFYIIEKIYYMILMEFD